VDVLSFVSAWDSSVTGWARSLGWPLEAFARMLLAVLAGGLVGLEREFRGRQAGFRTNILVCLGSSLVMLVSIEFARRAWPMQPGMFINVDPARIAYGVMTGVGFLGAGTILHNAGQVRGLTTAAAMWCVASIGLSAGLGMYLITFAATILVVTALWILDYFEDVLPKVRYRTVTIRRKWHARVVAETVARFEKFELHVVDAAFDRTADLVHADINLKIAFMNKQQYYTFEHALEGEPDYQLLATREL
jgi:putative Mg2+ transporter-C (MgtC) family protein